MKGKIQDIIKELSDKLTEKFEPFFKKLKEEHPELAEEFYDLTQMSIVAYFLDQAVEHWLDKYEE